MLLKKFAVATFPRPRWKRTHGTWRRFTPCDFIGVIGCLTNAWHSMAGGETSGSAMASIIYFILKNPSVHQKLNNEVRSAYTSFDDINISSTTKLEYLMAVLKEGMRIFPTAPQGTPRISPGVEVEGYFVPPGVSARQTKTTSKGPVPFLMINIG